jgi:hypothetical protein
MRGERPVRMDQQSVKRRSEVSCGDNPRAARSAMRDGTHYCVAACGELPVNCPDLRCISPSSRMPETAAASIMKHRRGVNEMPGRMQKGGRSVPDLLGGDGCF